MVVSSQGGQPGCQLFKKIPQLGVNPDEAIARGAAIQAALIFRNQYLEEVILTDVMPFSLGTDTSINLGNGRMSHGHFSPIIERNMPVPVSRSKNFVTALDNQTEIKFDILQVLVNFIFKYKKSEISLSRFLCINNAN